MSQTWLFTLKSVFTVHCSPHRPIPRNEGETTAAVAKNESTRASVCLFWAPVETWWFNTFCSDDHTLIKTQICILYSVIRSLNQTHWTLNCRFWQPVDKSWFLPPYYIQPNPTNDSKKNGPRMHDVTQRFPKRRFEAVNTYTCQSKPPRSYFCIS